jgi:ABC-type transporter Mla subunit MlaD
MAKSEKDVPELVRAAQALEDDLERFEDSSKAVRKIHLDSEKHLARAQKELADALTLPERLADHLRAVASALAGMQARQQASLDSLAGVAADIERRKRRLEEHMQAFAALGKSASDASELLQSEGERPAVLEGLMAGLAKISEDARALLEKARSDDFPEVAREADSLHQRMAALRRRLESSQN